MTAVVPTLPETLAAVDVLVRAGVSDESVGRAVREWLAQHRQELGSPPPNVPGPPLEVPAPAPQVTPAAQPSRKFEFVKVRLSDETVTNIAIPLALFQRVVLQAGGEKAARSIARELAKEAPATSENRSSWVAQRLAQRLPAD